MGRARLLLAGGATALLSLACAGLERQPVPDVPIECETQLQAWRAAVRSIELEGIELVEVDEGPLAGVTDSREKMDILHGVLDHFMSLDQALESGDWESVEYFLPKLETEVEQIGPAVPELAPQWQEAIDLSHQALIDCQ